MVYFLCKAYDSGRQNCYFARSLPVRGAWVEMGYDILRPQCNPCRSPCGERGLKYDCHPLCCAGCCVAPRAGSVG